jgi:hypothetical protein
MKCLLSVAPMLHSRIYRFPYVADNYKSFINFEVLSPLMVYCRPTTKVAYLLANISNRFGVNFVFWWFTISVQYNCILQGCITHKHNALRSKAFIRKAVMYI